MALIGTPIVAYDVQSKLNALSIAQAYRSAASYAIGDYAIYKGTLYRCSTAITTAEEWTAAHWTAVSVEELLDNKVDKSNGLGLSHNDFTDAYKQKVDTNESDIDDIQGVIPAEATSANKLADKAYVTAQIRENAVAYRGSFATKAALLAVVWQTSDATAANYVDNNDVAVVLADESNGGACWRYAYTTGTGWGAQYKINDSPLTEAQAAALNSGATAAKINAIDGKYVKPGTGIPKTDLANDVQASLEKADSAIQQHQSLAAYRTASDQDTIDAAQDAAIGAKYTKPGTGVPKGDLASDVQTSLGKADTALQQSDVDNALSDSSTKPVQNKVAKAGIDAVQGNLDDLGLSVVGGALNETTSGTTAPLIKDSTGKKIRDAIKKISGVYDFSDYKSITAAVRNGDGAKIPNGTTFVVPHSVYGNIDFVVRRKNVDKVYNDSSRPTLTIQTKYLLSNNAGSSVKTFVYDSREAFASITEAIEAGTVVKFTATKIDSWDAGTYNFTATNAIAVGSKLKLDNHAYNTGALTTRKVQVFADAKSTTPVAEYAIASGDGDATVNLGTWGTELNHAQRNSYGSNNEEQSNLFQWLNASGLMSDVFVPKTKYDMMDSSYASLQGFLGGFPQDFLDCLGLCSVHNLTNDVFESQDSTTAKSNEYTHNAYFWLPSRKEIYGTNENAREDAEAQFAYYADIGTANADKLMYAKGASSPSHYWLRTPYAGHANNVRFCGTGYGGALYTNNAYYGYGVAPLAILA